MLRLSAFLLLLFPVALHAQVSDFISVRKPNGRTVKTFISGAPILLETVYGTPVSGWIAAIRNDSIFIKFYVVQRLPTTFGTIMFDTLGSRTVPIHYQDIKRIKVFRKKRFIRSKADKLLIIGGAGYFILNLANGAYLNESVTDKKNVRSLGISLGAIGIGWIINRYFPVNNFSSKKHKIVYVWVR